MLPGEYMIYKDTDFCMFNSPFFPGVKTSVRHVFREH